MSQYFKEYLKKVHFEKYYKSLVRKIGGKKVIIYGTGMLFQYIQEHYDLSVLNIIGVSDIKYSKEQEGELSYNYKIIPKDLIINYEPNYLIVASENYLDIIENMQTTMFKDSDIIILPLVKKTMVDIIKHIWNVM